MRVIKSTESEPTPWHVVDDNGVVLSQHLTRTAARDELAYRKAGPVVPTAAEDRAERVRLAKEEHAAIAAEARKPRGERQRIPTPNLDALNAEDPSFVAEARRSTRKTTGKVEKATHTERPELGKGEVAVELRNAKHGKVVADAVGKAGHEVKVDWLVFDRVDAAELVTLLDEARSGRPMFDGRVLSMTAVAVAVAVKLRTISADGASASVRAAVLLNRAVKDGGVASWAPTYRSDGQVEFGWTDAKGREHTGTARAVVAAFAPAEVAA